MLSCREVAGMASDYVDDALPLRRRAAVAWHVRLCPNCRAYLATLKRSIGLTQRAPAEAPSAAAEDRLAALFRDRKRG